MSINFQLPFWDTFLLGVVERRVRYFQLPFWDTEGNLDGDDRDQDFQLPFWDTDDNFVGPQPPLLLSTPFLGYRQSQRRKPGTKRAFNSLFGILSNCSLTAFSSFHFQLPFWDTEEKVRWNFAKSWLSTPFLGYRRENDRV